MEPVIVVFKGTNPMPTREFNLVRCPRCTKHHSVVIIVDLRLQTDLKPDDAVSFGLCPILDEPFLVDTVGKAR